MAVSRRVGKSAMDFVWSDAYSIAVPEMDAEHQGIFRAADALCRAAGGAEPKERLRELLKQLIGCSQAHFASEEQLMESAGYPGRARHKRQHDKFVNSLLHLQGEFEADRAEMSVQVLPFLRRWISHHITNVDRAVGAHVTARAAGARSQ